MSTELSGSLVHLSQHLREEKRFFTRVLTLLCVLCEVVISLNLFPHLENGVVPNVLTKGIGYRGPRRSDAQKGRCPQRTRRASAPSSVLSAPLLPLQDRQLLFFLSRSIISSLQDAENPGLQAPSSPWNQGQPVFSASRIAWPCPAPGLQVQGTQWRGRP